MNLIHPTWFVVVVFLRYIHESLAELVSIHPRDGDTQLLLDPSSSSSSSDSVHQPSNQESRQQQQQRQQEQQQSHDRGLSSTAPLTGVNIRALIVLVVLKGHEQRMLPDRSHFEQLCDGGLGATTTGGGGYFQPSFGTASHYLFQQSSGQYKVICQVTDWIVTNQTESFFAEKSNIQNNNYPEQAQSVVWSVMDQVEETLIAQRASETPQGGNGGDDWYKVFDTNGDSAFDAILIIHSGFNAQSNQENSPCDNSKSNQRVSSQAHSETPGTAGWKSKTFDTATAAGGIRISNFVLTSAFRNGPLSNCDQMALPQNAVQLPMFMKEWVHMLAGDRVPPLYDSTVMTNTSNTRVGGLGNYDLLSAQASYSNNNNNNNNAVMASLSAYTKLRLNWLVDVQELDHDAMYFLQDINVWGQALKLTKGMASPTEYILIVNRQIKEYDANIVPTDANSYGGGILFYHIDETVPDNTLGGGGGIPPSPTHHYRVAILPKDGKYDLELGMNNGDQTDFWYPGDTLTSIRSYTKGSTGVSIKIFASSGSSNTESLQVAVSGISNPPLTFPSPPTTPAPITIPTAPSPPIELFIPTAPSPPVELFIPTAPAPPPDSSPMHDSQDNNHHDNNYNDDGVNKTYIWVALVVFLGLVIWVIRYMRRLWKRMGELQAYNHPTTAAATTTNMGYEDENPAHQGDFI